MDWDYYIGQDSDGAAFFIEFGYGFFGYTAQNYLDALKRMFNKYGYTSEIINKTVDSEVLEIGIV